MALQAIRASQIQAQGRIGRQSENLASGSSAAGSVVRLGEEGPLFGPEVVVAAWLWAMRSYPNDG